MKKFNKSLSANDVGATGAHQAGILIPKSERELLEFLPYLDPALKNPDSWIDCVDNEGNLFRFRFVYYNNKLHDEDGTRSEYRLTYMTKYFRNVGAKPGDTFEISKEPTDARYLIATCSSANGDDVESVPRPVKLTGWRRVH